MRPSRTFGTFFTLTGVMHFLAPDWYEAIVPPRMPAKRGFVYGSGIAEILGGVGVMFRATRRAASVVSMATVLAVFPANLYMATDPERFEKKVPGGRVTLYARLPLQVALMAWAHAAGRRLEAESPRGSFRSCG
ncbi:MAG: hypothetical protein M3290_08800 [Actinomycetota bacterium]|nr:hypothetical protein [Actinomycetota bacterium]